MDFEDLDRYPIYLPLNDKMGKKCTATNWKYNIYEIPLFYFAGIEEWVAFIL